MSADMLGRQQQACCETAHDGLVLQLGPSLPSASQHLYSPTSTRILAVNVVDSGFIVD
jgi:hypothetical protein